MNVVPFVSPVDRIPPSNLEAEMALLGSILVDKEMMSAVSEIVQPSDFYASLHESIFLALFALYERGEPLDKVSLAEELKNRGMLDKIGGMAYLNSLMDTVPTAASVAHYAGIVRGKAQARGLIRVGAEVTRLGYESEGDVPAAIERAERLVREVSKDAPLGHRVIFTRWDAVRLERVNWLMIDRLPSAELTIIEGDGGLGKTTAVLDWAARISRGWPMPEGTRPFAEPRDVLLVADEDRVTVLKARLLAAGADMRRIHHVDAIGEGRAHFSLPTHGPALRRAVQDCGAVLVFLDALFNHFDQGLKSGITEDVRRVLAPLSDIAHDTGAAVIGNRHWGKERRAAGSRGLGSVDIVNVARSVLAVGRHPHDDNGPRIIAVSKSNLGQDFTRVRSLTFRLETAIVSEGGVDVSVGRVVWGDEAEVTADELATTIPRTADENSATALHARRIEELVQEAGDDGAPASEILRALTEEGCSRPTFFRALKKAKVVSISIGGKPRRSVYRLDAARSGQSLAHDHGIDDTSDTTDTLNPGVVSQSSQVSHVSCLETAAARPGAA